MKNFYPGTGTTLCPHCGTHFKVTKAQLQAHHGMVRCGHCLQAFDTRPNFAPEEINPQLELPILDETDGQTQQPPVVASGGSVAPGSPEADLVAADHSALRPEADHIEFLSKRRSRFWAITALPLLLVMLAQATYLFRVDIAARLPALKPALDWYCQELKCSVPLPQRINLVGIESSELKDDPAHKNQIILIALLRNRATYQQAFPNLELTLTDSQDKALARRTFRPEDYLPTPKNPTAGLPANQELGIKLHLDTANLKPVGYRLALFYPNS